MLLCGKWMWLFSIVSDANHDQKGTSDEADPVQFTKQELDHEADAESGDRTIDRIACSRSEPGEHTSSSASRQRPGNAQNIHRTYRRRDCEAGHHSSYEQIESLGQLAAFLQSRVANDGVAAPLFGVLIKLGEIGVPVR